MAAKKKPAKKSAREEEACRQEGPGEEAGEEVRAQAERSIHEADDAERRRSP